MSGKVLSRLAGPTDVTMHGVVHSSTPANATFVTVKGFLREIIFIELAFFAEVSCENESAVYALPRKRLYCFTNQAFNVGSCESVKFMASDKLIMAEPTTEEFFTLVAFLKTSSFVMLAPVFHRWFHWRIPFSFFHSGKFCLV